MKILLINTRGSGQPPLGLMYLASSLERDKHEVNIVDLHPKNWPRRSIEYLEKELAKRWDIIGLCSTTPDWKRVVEMCKKVRPFCKTLVIGGSHPSILREIALKKYNFIDIVIYGEGEETIREVAKTIEEGKKLKNVKGIVYRDGKKIITNPPRNFIENLDEIPYPARHLVNLDTYHASCSILTSRGCPYQCVFCSKPVFESKWRARGIKEVVDEIEYITKNYEEALDNNKRIISIADDCFNLNKKRAKAICDEIAKRNLNVKIACVNGLHVKPVDFELFQKLKKSGCREIWFGVESGNQEVLNKMKKGITLDEVRNAVKLAKKAEIEIIGAHFMIGHIDETVQAVKDTINFMKELQKYGLNDAGFNITAAFPKTELWEWIKSKNGFRFEKFEEDYSMIGSIKKRVDAQFETPELTIKQKHDLYLEAIKEVDKLIRKRCLSPKNVFLKLKSVKSYKDLIWCFKRFISLFLEKDLRHTYIQKPEEVKRASGKDGN